MVKVLPEAVKVEGSKIVWMKREEGTRESERCGGVFKCSTCMYVNARMNWWSFEELFSGGEYEYLRSKVFGCFLVSKITAQMTTSSSGHSAKY